METKFFVKVPFAIKDKAKSKNAKFDPDTKSWYVNDESETNLYELKKVDVKYELKDIAKQNGAIWDQDNKCWVTCSFNVDNINNLMQNQKITVLVNKKNELIKNPEIKLIHEINDIKKESNKMIFPTRW